jgi:CRP-like cAMP-binding protein
MQTLTPDSSAFVHFLQSVYPSGDAVAKEIASHFQPTEIKKGAFFVEEGRRSNEYLFLEKGIMRSYLFDTEGTEVTTHFYSQGNVVFEAASFFQHLPSPENIQAVTDCTGWKITFNELNQLFHALPAFRETGRAILVNTLVSLKLRTLSMINQTAEQRYAALLSSRPELFQSVPLKYIASYLGITDSSLSRIRKEYTAR